MDPEAYEIVEGIAEIFDSLDVDHDEQISLEEFLEGTKRHPELLNCFFKDELSEAPRPSSQTSVAMEDADPSTRMDTTTSIA